MEKRKRELLEACELFVTTQVQSSGVHACPGATSPAYITIAIVFLELK
jgi:hypothetical protein